MNSNNFIEEEKEFNCPCNGENSQCTHCNGSGRTPYQIKSRTWLQTSLDKIPPNQFRSRLEKQFSTQLDNALPHLKEKFLKTRGKDPAIFVDYLNSLIKTIEKNPFLQAFLLVNLKNNNPRKFLEILLKFEPNEKIQIIILATKAIITCYDQAKIEKSKKTPQKATPHQQTQNPTPCPHCGKLVYDQDKHEQLVHPGLKRTKPSKYSTQKTQTNISYTSIKSTKKFKNTNPASKKK